MRFAFLSPPTARMSAPARVRVPQDNLDGIRREPRAPGSQQVNAEELLAELVRLVESPALALKPSPPKPPSPPVETVSEQNAPDTKPTGLLETTPLRPSFETPSRNAKEMAVPVVEPPRALEPDNSRSNGPHRSGLAAGRRSGVWTFRISALVLAGAAVIGSILWLEQVKSQSPEATPSIAAAQSPAPVQPSSNPSVASSSDAGVTPPRDILQPAEGNTGPEERPIDPNARDSLEKAPPSQDLGPTAIGVPQPTAPSAEEPPAASGNTPAAAEPATAPQSSDSKAVPPVSLPPDPTQTATPSATDSSVAAHASAAPLPPVRPIPKAAVQTGGIAQRSAPKPDSPAKPSSQSAAHVVAKAGASGPEASETKTPLKTAQASVEPQAAPLAPPAPAPQQPNPNPVMRAFGSVVGAVGAVAGLIPFPGH
jgi:hypothetical protein